MMVIPRQKGNIELPVTIVTSGSSMFPLLKEGLNGGTSITLNT